MKKTVMQIPLVAFVGLLVTSSFCVLHVAEADDKTFQGPDPATKKVIQDSLDRLKKTFGDQDKKISATRKCTTLERRFTQ